MRGGKNKTGYTITEVLIVLAISSAMFIAANSFISGRVAETSFRTGVNETASRIQDVIDQVASGQFNDRQISCTNNGASIIVNVGTNNQGSNIACVFAGKLIDFNTLGKYIVKTYAAPRTQENSNTFSGTVPITQFETTSNMPGGMKVSTNPQYLTIFGFSQNPSPNTASNSGSGTVWFVDSNFVRITTDKTICLTDGKRAAKIAVGDSSGNMGVKTDFLVSSC